MVSWVKVLSISCRVGLKFPTVEVRYNKLHVEAECEVVSGKPLPTLWNSLQRMIFDIAKIGGLKSRKAKISIINEVSGIIKPGRVGLKFPTVEVRYNNLHVEAECEVVSGKPLPTLWNSLQRMIFDIAKIGGLKSRKAKISIINEVSGIIKPGRLYNDEKVLFVVFPFPGTGPWTGAIIASVLRHAILVCCLSKLFWRCPDWLFGLLMNLGLKHLEYQNTRRSHLLGFNTTGLHTHLVNRCAETLPHATPWISRKRVSESTDLDLQGECSFIPLRNLISCKIWLSDMVSSLAQAYSADTSDSSYDAPNVYALRLVYVAIGVGVAASIT
ncbi:hypothetical protein DCAR_0934656 [Daucus carota subsp. sativus]|uniref:Uncharacterized protein n=1 Tax=Daucus carota subsp. sativus TaxID=79200 RepID=A0A162AKD0_DAUCS|nr:hypothetical protein DCAR_0934656 [Daucus carota subsp. sativus]